MGWIRTKETVWTELYGAQSWRRVELGLQVAQPHHVDKAELRWLRLQFSQWKMQKTCLEFHRS